MAIHEKYLSFNRENEDNNKLLVPWNKLSEDVKNYYREQVKNIPNSLLKINYDVVSVKEKLEIYRIYTKRIRNISKK